MIFLSITTYQQLSQQISQNIAENEPKEQYILVAKNGLVDILGRDSFIHI